MARLIDLNEQLDLLPGSKLTETNGMMEIKEIFLNSMPNSCINQAYVQGFYCNSITFKNYVNVFEI